jgi:nitroreductase
MPCAWGGMGYNGTVGQAVQVGVSGKSMCKIGGGIRVNTLEAISNRRSIRRFKDAPVPQNTIVEILQQATLAPSGKNRQPWRFVVVREDKRDEMVRIMRQAIERVEARGEGTGSSKWTANVMEQAPVTVFVFNPYAEAGKRVRSVVDVQSVGAAIQNMLLAAQELGLGTLWICDVFYAHDDLCSWLGRTDQMIAAVSLGYPDERPGARPRKGVEEVTTWL